MNGFKILRWLIKEFNRNKFNELGELRSNNYQVVGANCIHPNGNKYQVIKDVPIKHISKDDLLKIIKPYLREEQEQEPIKNRKTTYDGRMEINPPTFTAFMNQNESNINR